MNSFAPQGICGNIWRYISSSWLEQWLMLLEFTWVETRDNAQGRPTPATKSDPAENVNWATVEKPPLPSHTDEKRHNSRQYAKVKNSVYNCPKLHNWQCRKAIVCMNKCGFFKERKDFLILKPRWAPHLWEFLPLQIKRLYIACYLILIELLTVT